MLTVICHAQNIQETKTIRKPDKFIRATVSVPKNATGLLTKLDITIHNKSQNTINFVVVRHNVFKQGEFELIDKSNKENVPLTLFGKKLKKAILIHNRSVKKIKPNSSYSFEFPVSRLFDLSLYSEYELTGKLFYLDKNNKLHSMQIEKTKFSVLLPAE
jgi:hypothetical protein